jgi:hypothetical protein
VLIKEETLWKNDLKFVKDIPMIYVNFITIVIIFSEKKYGASLSYFSYLKQLWEADNYSTRHAVPDVLHKP